MIFKAIFSDMAILKLIEDPQAPGVLFAGVKIHSGNVTPRISVYSMASNRKALDTPKVTGGRTLFIRMLCERLERPVLTLLMLMPGFEHLVARELVSIARRCRVGRSFVGCGDSVFKFTKADMLYYIMSLTRGSETRIGMLQYLALRRKRRLLTIYMEKLLAGTFKFLLQLSGTISS